MTAPLFYIAEDGEAVGTLRRFSDRFQLTPASILDCLRRRAPEAVLLGAGEGRNRFLVVEAEGLEALCDCRSPGRPPQSTPC
ncbi:MAG: hypothetical protein ABEL04_05755 [Salinibacter sp.]|uniref:hypothetical protein n=1 Tax=Salinibacter sp. TaxID=2065818 RepID=UPI0035D4ACDC